MICTELCKQLKFNHRNKWCISSNIISVREWKYKFHFLKFKVFRECIIWHNQQFKQGQYSQTLSHADLWFHTIQIHSRYAFREWCKLESSPRRPIISRDNIPDHGEIRAYGGMLTFWRLCHTRYSMKKKILIIIVIRRENVP